MKKSTKFAALFAAVALLVIGAAMTAFAYGWAQAIICQSERQNALNTTEMMEGDDNW